jgi:hypothetical protein
MEENSQLVGPNPAATAALAELRPRLAEIVAARGSRRAAWELLTAAGLTEQSLRAFYALVRARGMDGALDAICTPERLPALRALVENPPPVPRKVAVSTLANQYYCEMQVHLRTLHDVRVVSEEITAGAVGHAALEAEAEPISEEEVERRIAAGEAMGLVEMGLSADIEGITVLGRADRVQLVGSEARLVLEFKFSGRRDVYASHVLQVEAYGTLLAARGFDTRGLVHAVAVIPRGGVRPEGLAEQMAQLALESARAQPRPALVRAARQGAPDPLADVRPRRVDHDAFTLWVFPHEEAHASRHLGWALGYWKGTRPPEATTLPTKCRACPFNAAKLCDAAAAPPDGRYVARRVDGRRGEVHLLMPAR